MLEISKYRIAVFLTLLFVALISAPSVILSFDSSVDVSSFSNINEEEENQHLKLVFEKNIEDFDAYLLSWSTNHCIGYPFKTYPKPNLNLISPPPDYIS